MSSEPENVLLDHAYDGIQEYDNPMPAWWVWVFVVTILFGPLYFFYYHMTGEERGVYAELASDMEAAQSALPPLDESREALLAYLSDEQVLAAGKAVFDGVCAACHALDGGGLVGPNMTDDSYIHIKRIEDFPAFIRVGNPAKAMQAYEDLMSQRDLVRVSAYMASLRGTTPAVSKDAEGDVIPAWDAE